MHRIVSIKEVLHGKLRDEGKRLKKRACEFEYLVSRKT